MRPFFPYFGSKWTLAPRYGAPQHNVTIEPFAGSACYSVRHNVKYAILYDTYAPIVATWRYLISATPEEIRRLPIDFESTADLDMCPGAKYLIGWWLTKGAAEPKTSRSAWGRQYRHSTTCQVWNEAVRERIASQLAGIRHWTIIHDTYHNAPPVRATWFIDPPYLRAGHHYAHWRLDYHGLAAWCREREGQIIVCEGAGAHWLPFRPISERPSRSVPRDRGATRQIEQVWP